MKRTTAISLSALSLALFCTACGRGEAADDPQSFAEMQQRMDKRLDRVLNRLNATPDQRQRIEQIKNSLIGAAAPLRQSRKTLRTKLRAEWQRQSPDRRAIHQEVDRQIELFRAFAHVAADRAIDLHGVLTPEQRKEVTKLLDEMHRMHRMWHGD